MSLPPGLPDEDIRNIIYRYHKLSSNQAIRVTHIDLFDTNSSKTPIIYRNFFLLKRKLHSKDTNALNELVHNHTFLPFISKFVYVPDALYFTNLEYKHVTTTLKRVLCKEIRYCPECISTDYETCGMSYIHRIHQFQHLDICLEHGVELITQCPSCLKELAFRAVKPTYISTNNCPHCSNKIPIQVNETFEPPNKFNKISLLMDLNFLLNNNLNMTKELLKQSYAIFRRKKHGNEDIVTKIKNSEEINNLFELKGIKCTSDTIGLNYIKMRTEVPNIFIHVILMRIFAGSVEHFFDMSLNGINNSNRKNKCLNFLCEQFMKASTASMFHREFIAENEISIIYFKCVDCHFVYKKNYSHKDDRFLDDTLDIHEPGEVWARGIELLNRSNDTLSNTKTKRTTRANNDLDHIKARVLRILENGPITRHGLKDKIGKEAYVLLRDTDPEWIEHVCPNRKAKFNIRNEEYWLGVDSVITEDLNQIITELKKTPVRISKNRIVHLMQDKKMRYKVIFHMDQLPQTKKLITQSVETKEECQLRLMKLNFDEKINFGERTEHSG